MGRRTRSLESRSATLLAVTGGVALTLGLVVLAGEGPPLAGLKLEPGGVRGVANDGRVAALSADGLTLRLWNADGEYQESVALTAPSPDSRPSGLALRGNRALAAYVRDGFPHHQCTLVDLDTGTVTGSFVAAEVPSRLFAAPAGWLFERFEPGAAPELLLVGDDGERIAVVLPPPDLLERATEAFGDASYALLRVVTIGDGLWTLPSFSYEPWSRSAAGAWAPVAVPECLRVTARTVHGEAARRRMLERAERAPEEERRHLRERVAWTRRMGIKVNSYATAVLGAAAFGDLVAVLTEPHPERETDRCRLDVWDTRAGRVTTSVPLAGACPGLLALGNGGAWLVRDGRVGWFPLPPPSRTAPCTEDAGG